MITATRAPLPGTATIVIAGDLIILDAQLTRDEATLVIHGVLPAADPAVVDSWVDAAFTTERVQALAS